MKQETLKRIISSVIIIPTALFFILKGSFFFIFFISIFFMVTSYEWFQMTKKKNYFYPGLLFLLFSSYSAFLFRNDNNESIYFFLMVLLTCVATDIGGYIFGKIFKGPKLTKISPNKTYAGMLGGYLLSLISTIIFMNDISISGEFPINWFIFVLILSSISQLGDITISYFKRISKIKNTGKIIPGHGGLLDRVDGMIFAFPFSYIILLMDFL